MSAAERLVELLERTAALYEELSRNCDVEQQAVQACDLPRLATIMVEKQKLAVKLLAADKERTSLQHEIAADMKRDAALITLAEIAAAPEARAVRAQLLSAGDRLKQAAKTAREKSDFGRRLIGRALGTVVDTIRCATALTGGETSTYSNAKTMGGKMRAGVMVTRSF